MHLSSAHVSEGRVFSAVPFVHFCIHPVRYCPQYLMNGSNSETNREYSLASTDDLVVSCRSKVKVTAGLSLWL